MTESPEKRLQAFADGYDRMFEHRSRFAICALLSREDAITFARFKELLNETDGNLGAQLRRLENAGYVTLRKSFENRRPVTRYWITAQGRQRLQAHLATLEGLIGK